jgi:hypothetical protein
MEPISLLSATKKSGKKVVVAKVCSDNEGSFINQSNSNGKSNKDNDEIRNLDEDATNGGSRMEPNAKNSKEFVDKEDDTNLSYNYRKNSFVVVDHLVMIFSRSLAFDRLFCLHVWKMLFCILNLCRHFLYNPAIHSSLRLG